MYDQIKSCVFTGEGLSEFLECTIGKRQGCMLSPFLFMFYLNEFISYCQSENCQGDYILIKTKLMLLLFADNMVNCANKLHVYCENWGLGF